MQLRKGLLKDVKLEVQLAVLSENVNCSLLLWRSRTICSCVFRFDVRWWSLIFSWGLFAFPQDQSVPSSTGSWHLTLCVVWASVSPSSTIFFAESVFHQIRAHSRTWRLVICWIIADVSTCRGRRKHFSLITRCARCLSDEPSLEEHCLDCFSDIQWFSSDFFFFNQ